MPLAHKIIGAHSHTASGVTADLLVGVEKDSSFHNAFSRTAAKSGIVGEEGIFKKVARLTLYNLIRYTPMKIRNNRLKGCRVFFYTSEYYKRQGKRGIRVFAYKTGCAKETYLTQIGFVDYTKNLQSSVWCHCSCPHFRYNYEYVLDQLGASNLLYAWKQPPREKNPNMVPGCCKHILTIVDDALQRTRQFARLDKNKDLEVDHPEIDIEPDKSTEYKPEDGPEKVPNKLRPPKPKPSFNPYTPFVQPIAPEPTTQGQQPTQGQLPKK
jgi:hypothetical protein